MDWLRERTWQLGVAILLLLTGGVLVYFGGVDGVNQGMLYGGLVLAFFAFAVPLLSKIGHGLGREEDKEE